MNIIEFINDPYEREARLAPALFASLPTIILTGLLIPSVRSEATWLVVVLASCGCLAIMRSVVRDLGKAVEARLWKEWGGMPTIARLRHRDPVFHAAETSAFHAKAVAKISGLTAPSSQDEDLDPESADKVYAQMSRWILANTRSTKDYPLIYKHNISYGFRRNLYGAKLLMIWMDLLLIVLAVVWAYIAAFGPTLTFNAGALDWRHAIALAVPSIHLAVVAFVLSKNWVQQAADAFAEQLIGAYHTI